MVRVSHSCSGKGGLLLSLRKERILPPMATTVVGCPGTTNGFLARPRGGGPIFAFELEAGTSLVEAFAFVSVVKFR